MQEQPRIARAIAIGWTAWAGIGMATRGSVPTMMGAAGIEMLPPECGIPTVRRELTAGRRPAGRAGPRLIELRFQAAGVWELGGDGRLGPPAAVDRATVVPGRESGPLEAVVTAAADGDGFDVAVVDAERRVHVRVQGSHTTPVPDGPGDRPLAPFRSAIRTDQ